MLNDVYKGCMLIGNRFNKTYSMDDWSASEECATVAKLVYELINTLNISMRYALSWVMYCIKEDGFHNIEDHMWDDYCRGFLAGEILGMPTEKNLELAEKAEIRWIKDNNKYGYYQEVLNEVKKEEFV